MVGSFDFQKDLKGRENRQLSFAWLKSDLKCDVIDEEGKLPHIDCYAVKNGKKLCVEIKNDYYPKTRNVCLELFAHTPDAAFGDVVGHGFCQSIRVNPETFAHLAINDMILSGTLEGERGLCFRTDLIKNHLLYYVFIDKDKSVTPRRLLFSVRCLTELVLKEHVKYDYLITRSSKGSRAWRTLSVLIPEKNLLKACDEFKTFETSYSLT
ncbi:MAG: hypothetical protein HC888_02400 [Candidatus Competibacteraceae bacterium]|nr:hypothetical protein [Candidatus Competibacteraceae bacterium]